MISRTTLRTTSKKTITTITISKQNNLVVASSQLAYLLHLLPWHVLIIMSEIILKHTWLNERRLSDICTVNKVSAAQIRHELNALSVFVIPHQWDHQNFLWLIWTERTMNLSIQLQLLTLVFWWLHCLFHHNLLKENTRRKNINGY